MPATLDETLWLAIDEQFAQALKAGREGDRETAARLGIAAWEKLPEPRYGWDMSYICLGAVVAVLRMAGQYEQAMKLVNGYLTSGHFQPYEAGPDFWLGTLHFEKGEHAQAYTHFERANEISKGRCFVDEDKRYRQFFNEVRKSQGITQGKSKAN